MTTTISTNQAGLSNYEQWQKEKYGNVISPAATSGTQQNAFNSWFKRESAMYELKQAQ